MNYKSKQMIQQEREGVSFLYVQVEKWKGIVFCFDEKSMFYNKVQ